MRYQLILLLMLVTLVACKTDWTQLDFLTHPRELNKAIEQCQQTDNQAVICETVMRAGKLFSDLVEEAEERPQDFGQRILDTQLACITQQPLLSSQPISSHLSTCDQAKVLLAVVSLSRPE
jgi:hypothetical protein